MSRSASPRLFLTLSASALLAAPPLLQADVKLPALISDNMVLMQDTPANVWGWADPQEAVTVKFGEQSAQAVAGADGRWSAKLDGLKPTTTGEMTVAGKNMVTIKNVAVGEVWVGSGQSNMEMAVGGVQNAKEEIESANFPAIRMFNVQRTAKSEPQTEVAGKWQVCTPQNTPGFSAVAYFFGRHLHQTLGVPIGLIHSSWGGTPAEFWTPTPVLAADPDFSGIMKSWQQTKEGYPAAKAKFDEALAKWDAAAEQAKSEGKPAPSRPQPPRGGDDFGSPGCLYNAMIAPLLPYTIRGVIWYQGESNASAAELYQKLFPTLIVSWREKWGLGEMPFLFVQLANFKARSETPSDSQWAHLREAQTMTLQLAHTGMAVAIDIGDADDIHPKIKQDVGKRLALQALATVYYQDAEFSGPLYSSAQEEEGKIRLSFRHADGLKAADGGKLRGFAIAGEDRKFVWADAEIQGDHIVVQSAQVPKPAAVRYAWADNPECNLVNTTGLPASPFRTDEWPRESAAK